MNFYNEIKNLDSLHLKEKVRLRIEEEEKLSFDVDDNVSTIGYLLDYNPKDFHIDKNFISQFGVDIRCFYSGYIHRGMKFVYGLSYDGLGIVSNDGRYYYLDTDQYIYDFCEFIHDKDIVNEFELFDYLLEFIRDYFGVIKDVDRDKMFQMIRRGDNRIYYDPISEHQFSWFHKAGNAMCSEYALIVQNVLSVFGMDSYFVIGREKTGNEASDSHAFNLVSFVEEDTEEEVHALIDFANYVNVFDVHFHCVGESPYIGYLDKLDEEFVQGIVQGKNHLIYQDYAYLIVGDELVQIGYGRDRDYYVSGHFESQDGIKKMVKMT